MENSTINIEQYIVNNTLTIHVKPNAAKTKLLRWNPEKQYLTITVHAPPEDNKANIAVIKFFSRLLKTRVEIARGLTSKTKVLKIL